MPQRRKATQTYGSRWSCSFAVSRHPLAPTYAACRTIIISDRSTSPVFLSFFCAGICVAQEARGRIIQHFHSHFAHTRSSLGERSCIILLKILKIDKFSAKLLTNAPSGDTIRCNLCKWVIYALLRILYVPAEAGAEILKRRRKLCQPLTSS